MAAPGIDYLLLFAVYSPFVVALILLVPVGGFRPVSAGAVWLAIVMAAIGLLPVVFLEYSFLVWAIQAFEDVRTGQIVSVLILAYLEEGLKLLAVLIVALVFRAHVAAHPRVLVWAGAAAGLSFGTIENFLYFQGDAIQQSGFLWWIVGVRTLGTLPMHIVAGMIVAWFVLRARQTGKTHLLLTGLFAAGTLHLFFNAAQIAGTFALRGGAGYLGVGVSLLVGIAGVAIAARHLRRSLADLDRRPADAPPSPPQGSGSWLRRGDDDDGPVIRR